MAVNEIILTLALAFFLLALAVYFIARQFKAFQLSRGDATLTADDRSYFHTQARRRVICSILMLILAGFLIGWVFIAQDLPDTDHHQGPAAAKELTPDEKSLMQMVTYFWVVFLLVLFAILALAALDFISTARFGLRHQRQLEGERRVVIEQEIARLKQIRRERNGQ